MMYIKMPMYKILAKMHLQHWINLFLMHLQSQNHMAATRDQKILEHGEGHLNLNTFFL